VGSIYLTKYHVLDRKLVKQFGCPSGYRPSSPHVHKRVEDLLSGVSEIINTRSICYSGP
jgi:hypothetical protein